MGYVRKTMHDTRIVKGAQTGGVSINDKVGAGRRLAYLGPVHGSRLRAKTDGDSVGEDDLIVYDAKGGGAVARNPNFQMELGQFNDDGSFNKEEVLYDDGEGNTKIEVFVCNPPEFLPHREQVDLLVTRLVGAPEGHAHSINVLVNYDGDDGDDDPRYPPAAEQVTFDP